MKKQSKLPKTKKTGRIKKAIAAGAITAGVLASALISPTPTDKSLPTKQEVVNNLETFGADTSYLYNYSGIENIPLTRLKIDTSKPLTFCLSDNYSDEEVAFIQYIIDDLNLIFEHINPNYKFNLQKGVTKGSILDNNTIPIVRRDNCGVVLYDDFQQACGWAMRVPTFNLDGTMSFNLTNISVLNTGETITWKYSQQMAITTHEIFHMLGIGDAYIIEGITTPTRMNSTGIDCSHGFFMENDLYLLASLYGKFETQQDYDNFIKFTKEYCTERDAEYHSIMADNNPNWFPDRPPHVSQADFANMPLHLVDEFLNFERSRYNLGVVSQEEIDAAQEREKEFINQQVESCSSWKLEQDNLNK